MMRSPFYRPGRSLRAAAARTSRWCIPLLALCGGWIVGHGIDLPLGAPAQAAVGMSPVERLLAESEIRNKIALYGFYADGDGAGGTGRNLRKLADTLMTPDVVSEIHLAKGGPPLILKGRDIVAQSPPEIASERAKHIAGRHYLISTVFDRVTPTRIETRTASAYFDATRNLVGTGCAADGPPECGGLPVKTVLWVYHMTWVKTPQGWQIARNMLRDDN